MRPASAGQANNRATAAIQPGQGAVGGGVTEAIEKERERIIDALHKAAGYCGHCGKRECAGRESWSELPERLMTKDILAAIQPKESE